MSNYTKRESHYLGKKKETTPFFLKKKYLLNSGRGKCSNKRPKGNISDSDTITAMIRKQGLETETILHPTVD